MSEQFLNPPDYLDYSQECRPTTPKYNFMATRYGCHIQLGLDFDPESGLTEQHHKQSCDINYIVQQAEKNGFMPQTNRGPGDYFDASNVQDYQTALHAVTEAQEAFSELPSSIRSEFENNPGKFLEFAQNPENIPAMREMGLLPPERPPVPLEDVKNPSTTTKSDPQK